MTEATRAENRPRTPEADRGGAQSGDARTSARAAGCCSHHHPHGEVETQANLAVQSSNRDSSDHAHAPHSHANGDHPHDHDHDHDHDRDRDHDGAACCAPAPVAFAPLPGARKAAGGRVRSAFRIMQMDCPTEETLIRKKLGAMSEVAALEFNLMQRMLAVEHVPGAEAGIAAAIRSLGMTPEQADAGASGRGALPAPADAPRPWWPLAVAGVAAAASEAATWLQLPVWLAAALALAAVATCGLGTYRKGWIALTNGNLNINALMSIAVTGAMAIGQWPEAAMVMVLFTVAELIEARSLDRARNAIQSLMRLAPDTVTLRQPDGTWQPVDAAQVALGAIVRVKPGERIGLDGEIVAGRSTVNQAPITGESLPVEKTEGDAVYAGTINEAGSFEYRVTAVASNTTLARIIHAVEEAQGAKAPTQRFVDSFARVYTPIVFAIALVVAIAPPLVLDGAWRDWIYRALVLLVIACPCALVISTPVTIVSGLAAAARRGILVKGGVYLEQGRRLAWLALDKTGTITRGKPVQTDFEMRAADVDAALVRGLAARLAARSDHPVSQAVAAASAAQAGAGGVPRAKPASFADVADFEAIPGRGVRGKIDGVPYWLGNHRLVEELDCCTSALEARLDELERQGKTVVMLIDGARVLGLFAVADTVKDTSRAAVAELHALGIKTAMLTGDNPHTAQAIAQQVGIDDARGNQLPQDKLAAVEALAAGGRAVGMVGDGINDAPALARADIGFAMGAMGTDTAIETADVALMDDDLRKIPAFVRLSRATHRVLVQNIAFALAVKAVFVGLTVAGMGTMWMAVFADAGASLIVVGNGLRLLRRGQ
ncbi:4-deoxy-4-formamido-L-arabinose-phosphoundecaprenol deformylase ArnD [Burkholderia pseudomallei MSHR338]|uniref:heavy metal translocating P-type ATPase n=1 Tax=Burkholderia pseudomallei TaxID=28450 RepID=UPI0001A489E2|nr:heavy metal translocating P-type ATPase [Burkholderia pseudomallei]ACQ95541.1 heavy metal cation transport ATPase [Burkholderia pseudomallei MSHR346]AIP08618.1 cadmium-translocating P-type ATPase [Burkholderia pseudomallei]EQA87664.1 4-deoxy-4-formamido-L-arabinose-phosphoundecaprenol deformylase ArnD [Burkholderia pseudomallei MSHR338]KGU60908.1 cadmium-translocating P-type ATPase [Burkholderia pseudomallei MSHR543]OMW29877.1 ATPase P [Burkholderia pseudomallei]